MCAALLTRPLASVGPRLGGNRDGMKRLVSRRSIRGEDEGLSDEQLAAMAVAAGRRMSTDHLHKRLNSMDFNLSDFTDSDAPLDADAQLDECRDGGVPGVDVPRGGSSSSANVTGTSQSMEGVQPQSTAELGLSVKRMSLDDEKKALAAKLACASSEAPLTDAQSLHERAVWPEREKAGLAVSVRKSTTDHSARVMPTPAVLAASLVDPSDNPTVIRRAAVVAPGARVTEQLLSTDPKAEREPRPGASTSFRMHLYRPHPSEIQRAPRRACASIPLTYRAHLPM